MVCLLLTYIVVYITFRFLSLTVNNIVYFIQHNLNLLSSGYSIFTTDLCCALYTIYTVSFSPINNKQWSICLLRGHRCLT